MKKVKDVKKIVQLAFVFILLTPLLLYAATKYFSKDVKSADPPTISSISPTSGTYLGGGSLTITSSSSLFSTYTQISSGSYHTCGIGSDGHGYCWGYNSDGRLGNGSTTQSTVPVQVSAGAIPSGVTLVSISAGGSHTCGLGSDGKGYCWGYNYYGQLGNGSTTQSNVPVQVSAGAIPTGVTLSSISAGQSHTCGLGSDGKGYCWGYNSRGQLGNGSTTQSNVPVQVSSGAIPSGVTLTSISAGQYHTCGIGSDGHGYCWGYNYYGQLGNGSTINSNVPVQVSSGAIPSGVTLTSISAGGSHTCGIGSDGKGYCWGYNNRGQLGNGSTTQSNVPVQVSSGAIPSGVTLTSISAGQYHTCGIGSDGHGYCWGYNNYGRLGNGSTTQSTVPVQVSSGAIPSGVTLSSISAGGSHTCGIGSDGHGYCWGSNSYGQLGNGSTTQSTTPVSQSMLYQVDIGNYSIIQSVSQGSTTATVSPIPAHVVGSVSVSLTRLSDNVSSNSVTYTYTNLPAPNISSITPSAISGSGGSSLSISGSSFLDYAPMKTLSNISAGSSHTCGIGSDGHGYCWGYNYHGQLGNGSHTQSTVPVPVSSGAIPSGVTLRSISAGSLYTCGIGSDGHGYCWGYNSYGRLGNGSTTQSNVPVQVSSGAIPSGVTLTSISAGNLHTCSIGSDGHGYCWGYNYYGQLGNGSTTDSTVPVQVSAGAIPTGVTLVSISAGNLHTCGIGSDGHGYCWGYNGNGQLGNGSTTQSNVPVQVSSGAIPTGVTLVSISAGGSHTCGIGSDGHGYCWGSGSNGCLGNGSTTNSNVPVQVSAGAIPSGVTLSSISTGYSHTCGIGSDGHGYCWGSNGNGELGNGSSTDSYIPIQVSSGAIPSGVTLASISTGNSHTCGIGSDNQSYCWGYNYYGQLGNMENTDRPTPSYVLKKEIPTIEFGTTPASSTTYTSTSSMSAVSPSLSTVGTVVVKLTNPDGQFATYNIFVGDPPSAPLSLLTTYGDGEVSLGWLKPTTGALISDYIIQYSNDGGSTWSTFNDGVSTNTFTTVTGLTNGHLYTFRVAAVNPAGTGPYSDTAQSVPQALGITGITPNSGVYLGGGSMTIEATGLGDTLKLRGVSSGTSHTCGLGSDGKGYCWGYNYYGQLGNGSTTDSKVPVQVSSGAIPSGVTLTSISAGQYHTCGLGSDGNGYCWGWNNSGQLGNGSTTNSNVPIQVSSGAIPSGVTLTSISAGSNHTCGLASDGHVYCWGNNGSGRLGNGSSTSSNVPVQVSSGAIPTGVSLSSISAGTSHTCGLGSDGQSYCWGYNLYGQLGNGSTTNSNVPVQVSSGAIPSGVTLTSISAGQYHTCGLGSDGNGYCWGWNNSGQLGNGSTTNSNVPIQVSSGAIPSGVTLTSISAGQYHTCGLGSDGNGYCWGYNGYGQLGNGSTTQSTVPVQVSSGAIPSGVTLSSISAGYTHTCGLGSDGHGYCWGYNGNGQLGNGSTTQSNIPVLVQFSEEYVYSISIGNNTLTQSVALGSTTITITPIPAHVSGSVSVNLTRLSDNATSNSVNYTYTNLPAPNISGITPSSILGSGGTSLSISGSSFLDYAPMDTLSNISAGQYHTCGLGSDGNGYCWGNNGNGRLGNGSSTSSNVPVQVSAGAIPSGVTLVSVSAGTSHTCGIGSDGNGYCWGYNISGELGNGSTTDSNIPVLVGQGVRPAGVTFSSIDAGSGYACGLGSDGHGYCWGDNEVGQLGNGVAATYNNTPVLVSQGARPAGVSFSSISAGGWPDDMETNISHTCGIGSDGHGYCWGSNEFGQLGNGSTTDSNVPVQVSSGAIPSGVTLSSISAGYTHTCGLGSDGHGYCWGWNNSGRLGNGSTTDSNVPVQVSSGAIPSGVTLTSISAGYYHTCGIGSDGHGYCWGNNYSGQLGNGSTTQSTVPVQVSAGAIPSSVTLVSISAGSSHTCGLGDDGHGYCWGYNINGQLGNMESTDRPTPSYILKKEIPTIEFGSTPATSTTYTSTTSMSAVTPSLSTTGILAVKLTNPDGQYATYNIFVGDPPSEPLGLLTTYGDAQVSLDWLKPTTGDLISDYIIQYSNDGGSTWSTFNDGVSTNTFTTVTGLTNGHLYTFRVAAVNPAGTGPYSATAQSVPQALGITGITPNSGVYLGGGSMTIEATGLGDTLKLRGISSGSNHTCGLGSDGHGYCWGYNSNGQLGNGSTTQSTVPVQVSAGAIPSGVTLVSISAGGSHTCGLGSDGHGYCWGYNGNGQLGNGSTTQSTVPVQVSSGAIPSGVTLVSISTGYEHTCGLGSDGHGYCWGYNGNGQLGKGSTTQSTTPVQVISGAIPTGVTLVSISAGSYHTCGIGSDGHGYCWGYNYNGQLGNGSTTQSTVPVQVSAGAIPVGVTLRSISAGSSHTCGIGSDGKGYCWGYNGYGRLGNGSTTQSTVPVQVSSGAIPSGVTLTSISAGSSHTCGIGSDGHGYCWGYNYYGQLGNGSTTQSTVPVQVSVGAIPSGVTLSSISAGYYHTCGIGSDNQSYCWGYNDYGQLGNGSRTQSTTPVSQSMLYQVNIGNNSIIQSVSQGSTTITITPIPAHVSGSVSVILTRLSDNVTSNSVNYTYTNLPAPNISSITPSAISGSGGSTLSISGSSFLDYAPIDTLSNISAGQSHTCGIGSDGKGYCWGYNYYGRLGNGSTTQSNVPVQVSIGAIPTGVTLTSISAGQSHTCGLGSDGHGYCWGYNYYGQLGNGSTTNSNVPVQVSAGAIPTGVTLTSISAGDRHTCGIGSDGHGYCWGYNNRGQLGNGSTTQSTVPVQVSSGAIPTGVTLASISAGQYHTCGLGDDGHGYCWGYNYYGQLGNGSTTNSNVPVQVSSGAIPSGVTLASISTGNSHTCGIGSDGHGYCWGYNNFGQLGNGSTTNSNVPVQVSIGAIPSGVTLSSISAVGSHTCGLGSDGHGYCWGYNYYGQLGNGSTTNSNVPVQVSSGAIPSGVTLSSISAGYHHTCGMGSDGHGYCWGYNGNGQLGNMETTDRPAPSYILKKEIPTIEFGSTPATSTTYTSTSSMSAVSPSLSTTGTLAVKLTNPDGQYATYNITVVAPPTEPLNLTATAGNKQVTLNWTVPSSNGGATITDYIVQHSTNGSTWTTFDDGVSTSTSATVTGLTNGQQYYFRVAAVNSVGQGPYTSSVTATPVNQPPTFTSVSNNSPVAPGSSVTWNTTASDSDGTVKLLVCKTASMSNGSCTGGQWCSSSLVSSNPNCSYAVPNPTLNGTYNAYVYIVDNQNAPATGSYQGSNSSFVVSNVAPAVVNVVLNGGNAIDLEESTTKAVTITATVVSANTCSSIASVKGYLYRSGVGYTGCDTLGEGDNNHCYPEINCTLDANSCTDPTSASANYTCIANIYYHADPTDSAVQYSSQNWLATVSAKNATGLTGTGTLSTGVEINSLVAIGVTTPSLDYGNLLVGQSNDPLNKVITTIPTGNVPLNQSHQGDGAGMCTDFSSTPSCTVGTPIDHSNQRYSLSASTSYASGTALTGSPVLVPINIPKATNTNPTGKNTWWGISIPTGTATGQYDGRVFILPVKKEV